MYRLGKDVDLSFFYGAQLLQVCVGKNELILNFDRGVRVTILSDFVVKVPAGNPVPFRGPAQGAPSVLPLLHDWIEAARATDDGGLHLRFRSGSEVEILDTSTQYESFWIANRERKLIV
ncbi:MAG TPA: DUF6188 family protein [Myxococcaceae bacterium]|nr:DUF6188 family protein [Myxococcaceae bacterium]